MAMVVAAIGNGGTLMEPHVVDRIVAPDGTVVSRTEPRVFSTPIRPKTAAELTAMMTRVVESGTGRAAQIPGVEVAGKTGTAETGRQGRNDTWFIAFAPAEDPQVAVAVALSDQAGTGGATAAPIARAVIETILERNP
jgi:peptidoglycan glycosyltransferase